MKTKTDQQLEKLIANEAPTAAVIKAALEAEQKERNEREIARVRDQIARVDMAVAASVEQVRIIRKKEKAEMTTLRALNAAREQFMKDANFVAFQSAALKVGVTVR